MADHVNDDDHFNLEDGMYEFDGRIRVCLARGVLYLPARMAHPMAVMLSQTKLYGVLAPDGALELFIRAGDLIPLRPDLDELVRAAVEKFRCQL